MNTTPQNNQTPDSYENALNELRYWVELQNAEKEGRVELTLDQLHELLASYQAEATDDRHWFIKNTLILLFFASFLFLMIQSGLSGIEVVIIPVVFGLCTLFTALIAAVNGLGWFSNMRAVRRVRRKIAKASSATTKRK